MNQLQAMRVFVRVVDLGSFVLAARQMSLSPGAVTRLISTLESHLKMRLLTRSTRSLSLTDAGRLYLDGCRDIIQKLDEVDADLKRAAQDPSGMLRLAAPVLFASRELGSLLAAYRSINGRVDFEVTICDTHVNMIEGGFDVCFTSSRDVVGASLVTRRLMSVKDITVASPTYLSRRGTPTEPKTLVHHDLLTVCDGSRPWHFVDESTHSPVTLRSTLSSTNCAMVREAALAHMGIAFLPRSLVSDDLASGSLREVLGQFDIANEPQEVSIVYSGRNYLSMKVRSFVDFVATRYLPRAEAVDLRIVASSLSTMVQAH
jgi:DNA-binding transcriptional LysR family regulator